MSSPRPRIDLLREAPIRDAHAPVHGSGKPEIAHSAIALLIEERMAKRLGPCPNIRGDRPPEPREDKS